MPGMNLKTAKVEAVSTEENLLTVWLTDGRILSLPLAWYPSLLKATPAERGLWQPSGAGRGIHWPALDYDLSIAGLLEGQHEHPSAARYVQTIRRQNKEGTKRPLRGLSKPTRPRRKLAQKPTKLGLTPSA